MAKCMLHENYLNGFKCTTEQYKAPSCHSLTTARATSFCKVKTQAPVPLSSPWHPSCCVVSEADDSHTSGHGVA